MAANGNGNGIGTGNGNGKAPELSGAERLARVEDAHEGLSKARTVQQARAIWAEHYLAVGHRVLGRLLLGQTVEQAMRSRRSKAAVA